MTRPWAWAGLALLSLLAVAPMHLLGQDEFTILPQLRFSHYRDSLPGIPADFTYRGHPIEAACLRSLLANGRVVPLASCPRPSHLLDCLLGENHDAAPWWDLRGYRGYC